MFSARLVKFEEENMQDTKSDDNVIFCFCVKNYGKT